MSYLMHMQFLVITTEWRIEASYRTEEQRVVLVENHSIIENIRPSVCPHVICISFREPRFLGPKIKFLLYMSIYFINILSVGLSVREQKALLYKNSNVNFSSAIWDKKSDSFLFRFIWSLGIYYIYMFYRFVCWLGYKRHKCKKNAKMC